MNNKLKTLWTATVLCPLSLLVLFAACNETTTSTGGQNGGQNQGGSSPQKHAVSVTVTNVSVSPNTSQSVSDGSTQTFTVSANTGYTLSQTVGGTCPVGTWSGATYTTGAVSADCSVSFSATINSYSVTPSGTSVAVSPLSVQMVNYGGTLSFNVVAATWYTLSTTVGGTCPAGSWTTPGSVYTTGAISENCTVTFEASSNFSVLHSFNGTDGFHQGRGLIVSGTTLYGMTDGGATATGSTSFGTIFSVGEDGTGFKLLHTFVGAAFNDGDSPVGSLVLSSSGMLYGMTYSGGSGHAGTLFQIGADGSGYTILHAFAAGASDGSRPSGSLVLSGNTLYGVTETGGTNARGTVFSIGTNGTGFTILHSFSGTVVSGSDGGYPVGGLVLSGTTLYGMTSGTWNGYFISNDYGSIFSIATNGTGFTNLYSFSGRAASDGAFPSGSLVLSGTTLYGMTPYGGSSDFGTIFSIGEDGSGYSVLRSLSNSDGINPLGNLIVSGNSLFGMTEGGTGNTGTIFQIGTDGSGYTILHYFTSTISDGFDPLGSLLISGGTLYGMASGGSYNDGLVFKLAQ